MGAHKLFFWKSKTKSHILLLKKLCNAAESSLNLLGNIQKHLFYLLQTKNSKCYGYKYGKDIFCGIVGGWYKELKVKEFCV